MSEIHNPLVQPAWMIGCGNMGGAIVEGWRAAGIDLGGLTVIRPSGTPVEGARTLRSIAEAGTMPALVVLAMKPQKLAEVAPALNAAIGADTIIVSLLAGANCAKLRETFPGAGAIVRAMPNLPVAVRRGVIGLFGSDADEATKRRISLMFAPLGYAPWLADEDKFAAVGAVAGSGPAYVARFIAALAKAGEQRGLSRELAATLALEMALGTAWLAAAKSDDMAALAAAVASPNGTTQAGLDVLDRDEVLDQLVAITIDAAVRRGKSLADEVAASLLEERGALH